MGDTQTAGLTDRMLQWASSFSGVPLRKPEAGTAPNPVGGAGTADTQPGSPSAAVTPGDVGPPAGGAPEPSPAPLAAQGAAAPDGTAVPRPMPPGTKVVHGKVPGPKNHLLSDPHGWVVDIAAGTIIANSLHEYKTGHGRSGAGSSPTAAGAGGAGGTAHGGTGTGKKPPAHANPPGPKAPDHPADGGHAEEGGAEPKEHGDKKEGGGEAVKEAGTFVKDLINIVESGIEVHSAAISIFPNGKGEGDYNDWKTVEKAFWPFSTETGQVTLAKAMICIYFRHDPKGAIAKASMVVKDASAQLGTKVKVTFQDVDHYVIASHDTGGQGTEFAKLTVGDQAFISWQIRIECTYVLGKTETFQARGSINSFGAFEFSF